MPRRLERSRLPAHVTSTLYLMNKRRRLTGSLALTDLLCDSGQPLGEIAQPAPTRVRPDAELEELATARDRLQPHHRPRRRRPGQLIGVVTVDDVLALLLPTGWRRVSTSSEATDIAARFAY